MRNQRKDEQWTARHEIESAWLGEKTLHYGSEAQRLKRRKIRVVAAVRSGILSLHQALERFNLSLDEFYKWEREVGEDMARGRHKSLRDETRAEHARLAEENRVLKAENKRLRDELNLLRSKNALKAGRPRGDADRSPE